MAAPQKFLFEVSFDHANGEAAPRRGVEKRFTRAEVEATRAAALAEGHQSGIAEAEATAASLAAAALDAIAQGVERLIATHDVTTAETQRRALDALRAIVVKALPALAAQGPVAEVEAFAAKVLHDAIDEPRVVLRVPTALYDAVQPRLGAIAAAAGYAGRMVLLADDTLAGGDARVEWADGGGERHLDRLIADIETTLARSSAPTHATDTTSP